MEPKVKTATTGNYKWMVMITVGIGTFMSAMSSSIVNIALPFMGSTFNADMALLEWVVMSYLLIISSLLLAYGRLGDIYGHKPVYILGLFIFTLGSLLCGLAPDIKSLIFFRVLQGLGAGMVMALGPALLTAAFPPTERGKAMGVIGMVVASALAAGPVLGGILIDSFSWRLIFYINLPVGLFGIIWGSKILKYFKVLNRQKFDFPGALFIFLTLSPFLLALSHGQSWGWTTPAVLGLLIFSILMLIAFIYREITVQEPLMNLALFKIRLFSAASVSALLNFMAMFAVVFLMPFYLKNVAGLPPSQMGLVMTASPLVILVVAPISGNLSDRIGSRLLSSAGMVLSCISLVLLSTLGTESELSSVMLYLALFGLGSGIFQSPNTSALMGSVPKNMLGIASGTIASMRNIGMVMGIAISGAVFNSRLPFYLDSFKETGLSIERVQSLSFTGAMHDAFLVAAALAALGAATSYVRGNTIKASGSPGGP